tara:strand:- start:228 stop:527 length:300 start_codon:yes stop_codon:yes gene_type:complete
MTTDTHSLPLAVRFGEGASIDTVNLLFCGLLKLDATICWLTGVKDGTAVYKQAFVSVRSIEMLDSGEPVLLVDFLDDTGDRTGDSVALRFSVIKEIEVA